MTIAEIRAAWERWMHRRDLTGDLDAVQAFTEKLITNGMMQSEVDLPAVLAGAPQAYLHGGLVYLHDLAQDDEGMMRERELFAGALGDYQMRVSLSAGRKQAARP